MYSQELPSSSSAQNDVAIYLKCMICYKDFNTAKVNKPDYEITKRIFDNYTRLLKVQLILPMQWNFRHENLPFCSVCTSTVTKLLELNEKLHIIQNEMRVTLQKVKIEILKTQDANCKRMVEPLGRRRGTRGSASHLEKVDYFRSFAVKDMDPDVRLNVNNVLLKPTTMGHLPKVILPLPKKQESGFELNSAVVKPFSIETIDQDNDEFPEYDNTPSPDGAEDYGSATNTESNDDYVTKGLIELIGMAPVLKPKDYVTTYFTNISGSAYKCKLCDRPMTISSIKSYGNVKRHIVTIHEKEKGYQCKYCPKTFPTSSEGHDHIRAEHLKGQISNNKSRVPSEPKATVSSIPTEEVLKRVIELNSGDKRPAKELYKRHYKKVGDSYLCKICTRQMKSLKDIVRHVHASHKGKPNFQCSYCSKKFMERYMCVKHLKFAHEKVMQEEYNILVGNENSEENQSSFPTNQVVSYTSYAKVGNTFKCKKCSFTSTYKTSVFRHNRKVHNVLVSRPTLVKFSFAKKSGTVSSLSPPPQTESSKNDKKFESDGQDGVLYVLPPDLNSTIKPYILNGNSAKKRYKCKSCPYGSTSFCNVRRHVRDIHLKIKPFVCAYCKQEYFDRRKCRLHVIMKHPQENESNGNKTSIDTEVKDDDLNVTMPMLRPERELEENQNLNLDSSQSDDTKEGLLNDNRLRRRNSQVSYVQETIIDTETDLERLCITLPKSSKLPFSLELLSKYIADSDSTFCLVCQKSFAQISHHIANVHEDVRHFQCFLCNSTFYYRGKCIKHLKEKCCKDNKKLKSKSHSSDNEQSSTSSLSTIKVSHTNRPGPKSSKNKSSSKKAKAASKSSQPLQSGVYKDYYDRFGKRFKCKLCKKRIPDSRRIISHFMANHKNICPFACEHCDEKFYAKTMLRKHMYSNHPAIAAELAKVYAQNLIEKQNGPQEAMDTSEPNITSEIEIEETAVKSETTWVEFSHPSEESRDQFLETNNDALSDTANSPNSPAHSEPEISIPEIPTSSTEHVDEFSIEKSVENDAPKEDYGCIVIHQQSNLNCDPFIDKDSANKCKVCNKSFKLRKLVIDHIKNVHLGVRRYQCQFCAKKYYHLAPCKTHVEDHHPPGSTEGIGQDPIVDIGTGEQPIQNDTGSFGSSDLQISNVRSQASIDHHNALISSEEITIDSGMMAVEEPMSFEPWRELPSSQDKNIEPFFAIQSDESEEDEEEPQFVVQEQNGMGFSTDYEMSNAGVIADDFSIYDIVGTENIIELPVNPVHSNDTLDYFETGSGFSCNLCSKEFVVRKSMINHVNVKHKQVARYKCKLCDKKYYHKYHVAQHIASIHMRKDIFKCRVCEKSYGHASGLKKHYAAAHGSVNFQSREQWCTTCKLPFQSPQDLIIHMSRIHPV